MTNFNEADAAAALARADVLLQQRDLVQAAEAYHEAVWVGAAADRCAAGRWTLAMLEGNFEAAWQQSDAIRRRGEPDAHRFWNGESIDGSQVMVRCLHGLGDSVQMLRYLPALQERCRQVVVEVPPRLLPLARCFQGVDCAITWGEGAPANPPAWNVQVEVMELPYLFRSTVADLPLKQNYLQPPFALCDELASRMGTAKMPRVGVVWAASEWDATRWLPMKCLERLLAVQGVEFWNLQGGKQHAMGKQSAAVAGVRDADDFGAGLLPLSSVIANLDLVITVDTLVAHLAGAIGKPAWILLQAQADWRWMHLRTDTPWYPTLQLWRQPLQGDWDALTTEVCAALQAWLQERSDVRTD